MQVVLVDDEKSIRVTLGDDIREAGYAVSLFEEGESAFSFIRSRGCDVLICDLKMPGMDGMALLEAVKKICPAVRVILITGYGTVETAVEAMKRGAYDYVVKPFMNEKIVRMLDNIADMLRVCEENLDLKKRLESLSPGKVGFHGMVGTSPGMIEVFQKIEKVAPTDAPVLIEGESGTGKELAARAIHSLSPRRDRPLVVLSCSAAPESLIEDELFGHEPEAFTGALKRKRGKFERADGATLFIDDIDDMSLGTQAKLVRVLQEKAFERLGGSELIRSDSRIITASKVALREKVRRGEFREDLFFRLNVITVSIPPLRKRGGDVELLAAHFKERYARRKDAYFSEETLRLMKAYEWPGNVRELENAVLRAAVLCGEKEAELKKEYIFQREEKEAGEIKNLSRALHDFEKSYITHVLETTGYHKTRCAEMLGISRKTLWEKMKQYGIKAGEERG